MFIHALLTTQLAASRIVLPNSTAGSVRVLHVDSKPVARSYDGLDWERTQGGATLGIDCSGGACRANISTSSTYNITSHEVPIANTLTPLQKASRLLTQATVGPTRATLESVNATTPLKWIHHQLALPPTLLREYFRRRANPRLFTARPIGSIRSACAASSRWHRFAFSRNDEGKTLQVVAKAGGGASLYINGELRTEVTEEPSANNMSICALEERVGGAIHMLSHLDDCRNKKQVNKGYSNPAAVVLENPQIAFSTANLAVTHTLAASEGPLAPLPGVRDASLLQGDLACEPQLQSATGLFLRDGDAYWRHDPRLQLLSNTIEQPYNGSVSGAVLPNVAKTFLNEHTCVPLKQQGSIASYTSATFQLNRTMIRHFYDLDDRLVYFVDGNP